MGVPTPTPTSSAVSAAASAGPVSAAPFPYTGLIVLAAGIFLTITIQVLPSGLLPEMSAELGVSESLVGLLVSVFAFAVVFTSTFLSAATKRISRHTLIVSVLVVFAVSVFATAFAPTYELVVASRIFGGLAHGLFWAVVGAYTAYLVPSEHVARAVAITLGGGSIAFVIGVPASTALGQAAGWRLSFAVLAGLTLICAFLTWKLVPKVDHGVSPARVGTATGGIEVLTAEYIDSAVPRRGQSVLAVVFVSIITMLVVGGQYVLYTYITPYLIREVGIGEAAVSPALFAYGIVGAIALVLVAVWLGRHPRASQIGCWIAILVGVVLLAALPQLFPVAVVAYLLWAMGFGALPSLLQTQMLLATSVRIRDTASAFYTTAFNAGIGGGALVGAIALDTLGLRSLPWIFAGIVVVAIALGIVSDLVLARRAVRRRVVAH